MKNAQAKIDALLDVLVEQLHDEMVAIGATAAIPEAMFARLKELILLSNLNNAKQAKEGKEPGAQSKVPDISNEQLMEDLKKTRAPSDNFPRRGPRNGKREPVAPPVPEPVQCAIHDGVFCQPVSDGGPPVCPECAKKPEKALEGLVSLKELAARLG